LLSLLLGVRGTLGQRGWACAQLVPELFIRKRVRFDVMQTLKDIQIGRRSACCVPGGQRRREHLSCLVCFFQTLENEGGFMLKNERLVRLHVLFEKHIRRAIHRLVMAILVIVGQTDSALGWKLSCAKCEHDLASPLVNSTYTARGALRHPRPGSLSLKVALLRSSLVQTVSDNSSTTKSRSARTSGFRREMRIGFW
jgi:hypothetical protein